MAVTIANVIRNARGLYFEATGDGATTALVVPHGGFKRTRTNATVKAVTGASSFDRHSGFGGFHFPLNGTPVAITSTTVDNAGNVTVNTTAAIANATKAYVVVLWSDAADE